MKEMFREIKRQFEEFKKQLINEIDVIMNDIINGKLD